MALFSRELYFANSHLILKRSTNPEAIVCPSDAGLFKCDGVQACLSVAEDCLEILWQPVCVFVADELVKRYGRISGAGHLHRQAHHYISFQRFFYVTL